MPLEYDFIIIGAGTAGCALAASLSSQMPKASILIVESGPDYKRHADTCDDVLHPGRAYDDSRLFAAETSARMPWLGKKKQQHTVRHGRIVGGSQSVNGGVYVRPTREDLGVWPGDGKWAYDNLRPVFREIEKRVPLKRLPDGPDAFELELTNAAVKAGNVDADMPSMDAEGTYVAAENMKPYTVPLPSLSNGTTLGIGLSHMYTDYRFEPGVVDEQGHTYGISAWDSDVEDGQSEFGAIDSNDDEFHFPRRSGAYHNLLKPLLTPGSPSYNPNIVLRTDTSCVRLLVNSDEIRSYAGVASAPTMSAVARGEYTKEARKVGIANASCPTVCTLDMDGDVDPIAADPDTPMTPGRRERAGSQYAPPAVRITGVELKMDDPSLLATMPTQIAVLGPISNKDLRSNFVFETVRARKEVIVCAGAIETPRLLMASGFGPRDVIEEMRGRDTLRSDGARHYVDNAHIGRNLQDQPQIYMRYELSRPIPRPYSSPGLHLFTPEHNHGETLRRARSSDSGADFSRLVEGVPPRCKLYFMPAIDATQAAPTAVGGATSRLLGAVVRYGTKIVEPFLTSKLERTLIVSVGVARPKSRGHVTDTEIQLNYLSDVRGDDARALADAVKRARAIMYHLDRANEEEGDDEWGALEELEPGFTNLQFKPHEPAADMQQKLGRYLQTGYHYTSTCRMSASPRDGVVDPNLRVYGVENLRVADLSVCPRVPTGAPSATALMIGWRCGEFVAVKHKNT